MSLGFPENFGDLSFFI